MQAYLAAIVEGSDDAIIAKNLEGTITSWNKGAENIFGYRAEEAIGQSIHLLIPPELRREEDVILRRLKRGERMDHFETERLRKGGERLHVSLTVSPIRNADGEIIGGSKIVRDVTEKRRVAEALRESEEKYRTLFRSIDEGFCVVQMIFDANERPIDYLFLEVNPAFEKQTGIQNAIGRRMRDIAAGHESKWFEVYGRVALTGEATRFQANAEALGRYFDLYAFRVGMPELRRVAILFTDITEKKRAAEHLERAVAERTAELRETVGELEGVSYSLSHDMRAPLRAIGSFSEIVLTEAEARLRPEEKELLKKSVAAAGRLDRLISDVLTYRQVTREKISLVPIHVEQLLRQIIAERPEFQAPAAEIEIEGPLEVVLGDEVYLTQCVTNLLDNAVKFVAPGARPKVRIRSQIHGNHVRCFFCDNGIGIRKEAQNRIFGIFERLHDERTYAGTGIGLAIVRKAAERMGGSVGVESEIGQGSCFQLDLLRPGSLEK